MQVNEERLLNFRSDPLWDPAKISHQHPIIIAGPCSAESPEQLLTTARELKAEGVNIFRAGVWKPRTYPNSFEGIGEEALSWLQEVRAQTDMLVGCEVGTMSQAALALEYKMDYIWIGARTTSSPFAISELASLLKDSDIPIIIKNPLSPSLDLWKGAIIRLINAGLSKIAVLHRGFDMGKKEELRYPPLWDEVIKFKKMTPGIPFYFDPSHIAGSREFLHPLIHKGMSLNYDGFMIESHHNPEVAWSDAKQQITPREISHLINTPASPEDIINLYRKELDHLDDELIRLISKRREISKAIGEVKIANSYSPFQPERYRRTKSLFNQLSEKYDVPTTLSQTLFEEIHKDSTSIQKQIQINDENK